MRVREKQFFIVELAYPRLVAVWPREPEGGLYSSIYPKKCTQIARHTLVCVLYPALGAHFCRYIRVHKFNKNKSFDFHSLCIEYWYRCFFLQKARFCIFLVSFKTAIWDVILNSRKIEWDTVKMWKKNGLLIATVKPLKNCYSKREEIANVFIT